MPRVKENRCRACGAILSGQFNIEDKKLRPKPGDFSCCAYCRDVSVYADDMTLREPTNAEWKELAGTDFANTTTLLKQAEDELKRKGLWEHFVKAGHGKLEKRQ